MPPPPPGFGPHTNPNRDYQLLAGDEAEAEQHASQVSAGRLFRLASGEAWVLCGATLLLLVASLAQIAFPKLAGVGVFVEAAHGQVLWLLCSASCLAACLPVTIPFPPLDTVLAALQAT